MYYHRAVYSHNYNNNNNTKNLHRVRFQKQQQQHPKRANSIVHFQQQQQEVSSSLSSFLFLQLVVLLVLCFSIDTTNCYTNQIGTSSSLRSGYGIRTPRSSCGCVVVYQQSLLLSSSSSTTTTSLYLSSSSLSSIRTKPDDDDDDDDEQFLQYQNDRTGTIEIMTSESLSTTNTTTNIDTTKFHFSIDRGGTFTDIYCRLPNGQGEIVRKLLSVDPIHYNDAPTEGIRQILQEYDINDSNDDRYDRGRPVPTDRIGSIRMGTTVATNALLERAGTSTAYIVTAGFQDIVLIGNQNRPNIFDLTCSRPSLLYNTVIEINERIILQQHYDTKEVPLHYIAKEGITGEGIYVIQEPDPDIVRQQLIQLRDEGIKALAICLLHAYLYPEHELLIGRIAESLQCFDQISLSHQIIPMIKLVSRSHTTIASAYLTPQITSYVSNFIQGFDNNLLTNVPILQFMKSDGGLTSINNFGGHQAILSGPAGGVIGYAKTTKLTNPTTTATTTTTTPQPVIGFDMGGTSTDVSRYDGYNVDQVMETITAGVAIQAPQLDIHTVAAGGGSVLQLHRGMFLVGPESVGANPGPVCYRKGGSTLAVTDANIILGRIIPQYFPKIFGPNENEELDVDAARIVFEQLTTLPEATGRSIAELAYGFLQVANEAMCRPIRNLTQMKGYDLSQHILACFGGAGPQHACAIAKSLGITKIFIHRYGGILSAYGLSMADAIHNEQSPAAEIYTGTISNTGLEQFNTLTKKAILALEQQGYNENNNIIIERYLNLRYDGTDTSIMILEHPTKSSAELFEETYVREYGFKLIGRNIRIDDYRIRAIVPGYNPDDNDNNGDNLKDVIDSTTLPPPQAESIQHRAYFESGWIDNVPVYKIDKLHAGHTVPGPCLIIQPISTIVIEENCTAYLTSKGDMEITVGSSSSSTTTKSTDIDLEDEDTEEEEIIEDPVQLSIFAHRFMGIAEQMGRTLQRTAISVNMKERLDFSCALFTKDGGLVANAPHIPVHLGAMERAVRFQVEYWYSDNREGIQEGDVLVSNHPQLAGGSHLPDITVITPVFHKGQIIFFVASRGHHADIGGIAPGSMPPHSTTLQDEGAMIIAFKLVKNGQFQERGITDILNSPGSLPNNYGTRNLRDNISDLQAQVAANTAGIRLVLELVQERGYRQVDAYMRFIQRNAELSVRQMLKDFVVKHGSTTSHAIDYMDDGSPIELTITIDPDTGSAVFDFTGTGPQVLGNHNAPPAVTYSAVIYSLRSLVAEDIPLNQGCLAPITFIIPEYSLLNPSSDAAVVGGNVLTSQRVVDVVLKAFKACAASQGCMNNLTFGDKTLGYYETIAGGAGAGPTWDGTSGIHTHCTNTRITDPEILERRYPVLLRQFGIRHGSGGRGLHNGGDGVIRELEPLRPLTMSILSERRTLHPYGMAGGEDGQCGRNTIIRHKDGIVINIGGRCTTQLNIGDRLRIETPGGGGYGKVPTAKES